MMLAVPAVLDIVQIVARFLTEQSKLLGTRDVELLLATGFVALHTGARRRSRSFAHLLANVACFIIPFLRNQLQDDRFHRRDIPEAHLRDVQGADDVRPALVVRPLQGTIPRRAQLAADASRPFLTFTLSTVPGSAGNRHDAVARLVHGHRTALAVTVDQRVLRPTPIIGANTATTDHLLHSGPWSMEIRYPSTDLQVPLAL